MSEHYSINAYTRAGIAVFAHEPRQCMKVIIASDSVSIIPFLSRMLTWDPVCKYGENKIPCLYWELNVGHLSQII